MLNDGEFSDITMWLTAFEVRSMAFDNVYTDGIIIAMLYEKYKGNKMKVFPDTNKILWLLLLLAVILTIVISRIGLPVSSFNEEAISNLLQ